MEFPTRLVSDFWPHGAIGERYGVFDPKLGVNTRGTFVVDAGGVVRRVIYEPKLSNPRDIESYIAALEEL